MKTCPPGRGTTLEPLRRRTPRIPRGHYGGSGGDLSDLRGSGGWATADDRVRSRRASQAAGGPVVVEGPMPASRCVLVDDVVQRGAARRFDGLADHELDAGEVGVVEIHQPAAVAADFRRGGRRVAALGHLPGHGRPGRGSRRPGGSRCRACAERASRYRPCTPATGCRRARSWKSTETPCRCCRPSTSGGSPGCPGRRRPSPRRRGSGSRRGAPRSTGGAATGSGPRSVRERQPGMN